MTTKKNIFHFTNEQAYKEMLQTGLLKHPSLESEGFIHCCTDEQKSGVLERYFQGVTGIIQVEIQVDLLEQELKWEGETEKFPHVYGAINQTSLVGPKVLI